MTAWWELLLRLLLATALGGLLGWEREARRKPAGFRTLMLVSLAAATYVLATLGTDPQGIGPGDRSRAMAAVAQGIGFLGAGVILQARGEVRWLTTAATLWSAAGIGLAVGLGSYLIAIAGGLLSFGILRWGAWVEEHWIRRGLPREEPRAEEHEREHPQA